MNTRIEASLKKRGDRAFARIQRTPSQMVRSLWSYADRHSENPQAIEALLSFLEDESPSNERDSRLLSMQKARQAADDFLQTWHIDPSVPEPYQDLSEYLDALREAEVLKSMKEQGYAL